MRRLHAQLWRPGWRFLYRILHLKWLQLQAKTGHSPVYRYSFDKVVPIEPGRDDQRRPGHCGRYGFAPHASDIGYVFFAFDSAPAITWKAEDRTLSDVMMTYWTNFARTGNPNGPSVPKLAAAL